MQIAAPVQFVTLALFANDRTGDSLRQISCLRMSHLASNNVSSRYARLIYERYEISLSLRETSQILRRRRSEQRKAVSIRVGTYSRIPVASVRSAS